MKITTLPTALPDMLPEAEHSPPGASGAIPLRDLGSTSGESVRTPRSAEVPPVPFCRMHSDPGLPVRRVSDPGPARPTAAALAPRQSLDRLRTAQTTTPATSQTTALTRESPAPQPGPGEAGALSFFAMQNARHAGPVAAVRTVVQGLIAPEVARAVASHPDVALGAQVALTTWSMGRRIVSQLHSERYAEQANAGFSGDVNRQGNSLPRRIWQGVQSLGIAGGDFAAMGLTIAARSNPALIGVAQSAAAIQVIAHLQAQFREALRPAINTVHVGNSHAPQPADGRNLRPSDVGGSMSGTFGAAAALIDLLGQMAIQRTLGGVPAWQASRGLAAGAGVVAGVANMITSSVEDHLVDSASARRMQQTDPSHVRHLHFEVANPFNRHELGRQAERVDARVFNTIVPGMIALGLIHAMRPAMQDAHWSQGQQQTAEAGVHAAVAGLMGGALLVLTVAAYQLNDTVRAHTRAERANGAVNGARGGSQRDPSQMV